MQDSLQNSFSGRSPGNLKAVLGPTNTGKTHYAIERMLAHRSGMIGLPLRLLAREVYDRTCARAGAGAVALITGEERIIPPNARYWVATVEAMPQHVSCEFVAIDEIQMATDLERGHVFTQRLLNARGSAQTLLLGSMTMAPIITALLGPVEIIERPRLSSLQYAGSKKITRVPSRSAIIAFSANEVYGIAELVRRQRGGAAIVMGALSPRTRNAQVEIYQNGDVDILVATDAIGMGLNLDIGHVAFSSDHKFDGRQTRPLTPAEMGQIAGRAGRYLDNGTFGVTGFAPPLENEMVERLHNHDFEPARILQWRNPDLDFSSVKNLLTSLEAAPDNRKLTRIPASTDQKALEQLQNMGTARRAKSREDVKLLWECCQIPDFRNISPNQHAQIVNSVFTDMIGCATISHRWFAEQVNFCDNMSGDIDALSNRIRQIRTWTFIANKKNWLDEQKYWQQKTRDIENRLSDALHERLTRRFVDKRTSILIRHLKDKRMTAPEINSKGEILIEGHLIGSIEGFRFRLARSEAEAGDSKNLRSAAASVIAPQILHRARTLAAAPNDKILLGADGFLRWKGEIVAELGPGDDLFSPRVMVLADESLSGKELEQVQERLALWLRHTINTQLEQILALRDPSDLDGVARGIAFQLAENLGILPRPGVASQIKGLDQEERAKLRKYGVRFGAYHIYLPLTLKPAPRELALILFALKNGGLRQPGIADIPAITLSGRTSFAIDGEVNRSLYEVAGFKVAGARAVRVDILERLADMIRPLISFDTERHQGTAPEGAARRNGFKVTVQMTSLLGCAGEDFSNILKSLGYRVERTRIDSGKGTAAAPEEGARVAENASEQAPGEGQSQENTKVPENTKASGTVAETDEAELKKPDGADPGGADEEQVEKPVDGPEKKPADDEIAELAGLDGAAPETERPGTERPETERPKTERPGEAEKEARGAADARSESEGPEFEEIWFPVSRRPQNPRQTRPGSRAGGGKKSAPAGKGPKNRPGQNTSPASGRKKTKDRHREKPIDPDSPFAALAALKLGGGDQ